jgi:hypothetical protein
LHPDKTFFSHHLPESILSKLAIQYKNNTFIKMVKSADKLIGKKIIVVGGTSGSVLPDPTPPHSA